MPDIELKRILITGATGYIGRRLKNHLLERKDLSLRLLVRNKLKVRPDVAMSGEITLRGRVLPVGGLREKAMGALRAGIHTILVPEKNRRELKEIPKRIRRRIKFVSVARMEEVLPLSLIDTEEEAEA